MSRASRLSVKRLVRSPMLHTARVRTPVKAPGPDTRMKISPYTRNGTDRIPMISRLKRKQTGAGTNLLVFKKASGIERTAQITVPINAMHTVSKSR